MVKDGIVLGKRYAVLSKIGAGGMADVYKGRDQMLNRYVAIKVLKKQYKEDENFVRKFRSEAQAAAGLIHPNIVNVYDVGEDRGLNYMVMELVEGITLKEYIERKGRLSHKETISIAIQMCMRYRRSTCIGNYPSRYQTTEYYYFQGRKGKSYGFWNCEGHNVQYGKYECDGIGSLYVAGAGKRRIQ